MYNTKIARVTFLSLSMMVAPGLIVACAGTADDQGTSSKSSKSSEQDIATNEPSSSSSASVTSSCKSVSEHDDAQCNNGGYALLDEINDESCEALNDAAEEANVGALTIKLPTTARKSSPATFSWGKKTDQRAPLQRLLDALEPSAHAHGRTDGDVYMLVFQDASCKDLIRVFTKKSSWTATSDDWSTLSDATGPISLTVVLATLDNSAVKDDTEASASKTVAFNIK